MKHTVFKGTEVELFNMDSIIKRIMLSAVHIVEKKTYIKISFSPHHSKTGYIVGPQHYNHGIRKRPQARTEAFVPIRHKPCSK